MSWGQDTLYRVLTPRERGANDQGEIMSQLTDLLRQQMVESGQPQADLAADTERKWTTAEMTAEFETLGFAAPYVVVRRRSDGVKGTLEFTHSPRTYFGWRAHDGH
jgi:hypothetical protein